MVAPPAPSNSATQGRSLGAVSAVAAAAVGGIATATMALLSVLASSWPDLAAVILLGFVGVAIVVPLGWHLAPDAVAGPRRTLLAAFVMATLPIIIGAFVVGLAGTVVQTVGGSTDPIAIVPGGLILGLLGIVFVGWAVLLYVTLPCSVAWIVAVRVINRIVAR